MRKTVVLVLISLIVITSLLNLVIYYGQDRKLIVQPKISYGVYQDPIINFNFPNENITDVDLTNLWANYQKFIQNRQSLVDLTQVGLVQSALRDAKILKVDAYTKGTQLKLLFYLEGNQTAIFKPQWYKITEVIKGEVYAGRDRFNAEILAFYVSLILKKYVIPPIVQRRIKISRDILPVATSRLLATIYNIGSDRYCLYGVCYYCSRKSSICEPDSHGINGALILEVAQDFRKYYSPWARSYNKKKIPRWQTDHKYCDYIKPKMSKKRLLDIIDVAIFDFLLQNGDRHHYEVLFHKLIYLDNGKGLRDPNNDYIDILAPLYQCCWIRTSTLETLKSLSNGKLKELLMKIDTVKEIVPENHINAIQRRLVFTIAIVENCSPLKLF